jgi:hypothetical protein
MTFNEAPHVVAAARSDAKALSRPLLKILAAWNQRLDTTRGLRPLTDSLVGRAYTECSNTPNLGHRLSTSTLVQLQHVAIHARAVAESVNALTPLVPRTLARSALEVCARLDWQFAADDATELLRRCGSLWLTELDDRRKLASFGAEYEASVDAMATTAITELRAHGFEQRVNKKGRILPDLRGAPVPSATEMMRDISTMDGHGDTIYRLFSGTAHGGPLAVMEHAVEFDTSENAMTVHMDLRDAALTIAHTTSFVGRTAVVVLKAHGLGVDTFSNLLTDCERTLRNYLDAALKA